MASILKVNEIQNASGTSALSVDLSGNAAFTGDVQADGVYNQSGDNDSGLDLSTNDVVAVKTGNTERMRVDNAGNVGIGTSSPSELLHVSEGASGAGRSADADTLFLENNGNAGITIGSSTTGTGSLRFADSGGTGRGIVLYDHSSDFMNFQTAGNERMRIDSNGYMLLGTTNTGIATQNSDLGVVAGGGVGRIYATANGHHDLNRTTDGEIIRFRSGSNTEGSISVSGTTVSYNGGHLARWSQLADNSRDNSLLKGTVLTNLDQMAVWGDEENEQLNCMAVSSVEGDQNVAGVFVNWDEDDDVYTNDMNIAMTGDMIIRIAQGTTVARGDLLMSAGDGTAKPQGDDIVRSKTIAKVTSTHVSHTYDDGSYCVPCVLMAC